MVFFTVYILVSCSREGRRTNSTSTVLNIHLGKTVSQQQEEP